MDGQVRGIHLPVINCLTRGSAVSSGFVEGGGPFEHPQVLL